MRILPGLLLRFPRREPASPSPTGSASLASPLAVTPIGNAIDAATSTNSQGTHLLHQGMARKCPTEQRSADVCME